MDGYIQLRFYVETPLKELELLSCVNGVDVRENNAIEDHVRFNLIFIDNFEMCCDLGIVCCLRLSSSIKILLYSDSRFEEFKA